MSSKDEEIRNVGARRRHLLYMVQRYLQENGMCDTAKALSTEARLTEEFELCDNIDLDSVYLDYASYYHLRFGKYPKVLRKSNKTMRVEITPAQRKKSKPPVAQTSKDKETPRGNALVLDLNNELQVSACKIEKAKEQDETNSTLIRLQEIEHSHKISCGGIGDGLLSNQEWQSLAELVKTTILNEDLKISWADIYGNSKAIAVVKEAVLAPLKYPQLFANNLRPWKSVLLHGPPGTGKTLLAKTLYAETRSQVTFFNVTASLIISKWRGESEKMLRILFQLAQKQSPSIIFFDEIECFTSKRDRSTDHEATKRLKNELLQLMDGIEQQSFGVFILASTNLPWEIDEAFLRRFEKKLLVQLPHAVDRSKLISKLLSPALQVTKEQLELFVKKSDDFTGDEIRLACKEITMQAVRERIAVGGESLKCKPVHAFEQIKPLSAKLMGKHQLWQQEYGS